MDSEKDKTKGSPEEMEKLTTPTSGGADIDDGKKSPEESKLLEGSGNEVKFIPAADPKNGDAKIDMENVRVVFSGMSKDELMKFANDPFWVRMRWFLFILFWLTWLAMLAGAIAIIFFAQKCPAAAPREWWEKGPIVPIDVGSFSADGSDPAGTLKGLTAGLDSIKSMKMSGIILSSILKQEEGDSNGGVIDFQDVDPRFGTLDDFKEFAAAVQNQGIKLMLTLTPNHSSRKHPWFIESEKKVEPYTDYYVWNAGKGKSSPPNNWLSLSEAGGSAWEWSTDRNEFYLHQFAKNQPDLNYRNPSVIKAFKDVLRFWKGLGVSGFRLDSASYLMEDKNLRDDPVVPVSDMKKDVTLSDYGFYRHIYTKDLVDTVTLLTQFKQAIASEEDSGVLAVDLDGTTDTLTQYYGTEEGNTVVELPLYDLKSRLPSQTTLSAPQLMLVIEQWLSAVPNGTWPNWLLKPSGLPKDLEGGLNMAVMMLEGTPVSSFAASSSSENQSSVAVERQLVHDLSLARESPSILYGTMDMRVLDDDIFAFTRKKSGNPGYMLLFNLGTVDHELNVKVFPTVPDEVSVQIRSPGWSDERVQEKAKINSEKVYLPTRSALVLTFVPEKH